MRTLIIILGLTLVTAFTGCQKKVVRGYGVSQARAQIPVEKRLEENTYKFENAEAVGYLDNPSPVYAMDAVSPSAVQMQKMQNRPSKSLTAQIEPQIGSLSGKGPQNLKSFSKGQVQQVTRRMITYDGTITTRSSQADSLIDLASKLADNVSGYVENRRNNAITLRIPALQFDIVFDSLMSLGENIDFRKSAEDITDAFRDTEMRIQVLNKTIERYVKLISLVEEDVEKLQLLREIERLREELETLEVNKKVLSLRAEFATIHFSVQARGPDIHISSQVETGGFEWIGKLDPFTNKKLGRQHKMEVPSGMVQVKGVNFWFSQSPGGTKLWTSRLPNHPGGTSQFWIDAIRFRLGGQFLQSDTSQAHDYQFIRFKPFPGSNYIYTVGLSVKDDKIYLMQLFFPDQAQENRYFKSIREVIAAEGKS